MTVEFQDASGNWVEQRNNGRNTVDFTTDNKITVDYNQDWFLDQGLNKY
jgi:hypothetical protein